MRPWLRSFILNRRVKLKPKDIERALSSRNPLCKIQQKKKIQLYYCAKRKHNSKTGSPKPNFDLTSLLYLKQTHHELVEIKMVPLQCLICVSFDNTNNAIKFIYYYRLSLFRSISHKFQTKRSSFFKIIFKTRFSSFINSRFLLCKILWLLKIRRRPTVLF